jgi:hypothetical protein
MPENLSHRELVSVISAEIQCTVLPDTIPTLWNKAEYTLMGPAQKGRILFIDDELQQASLSTSHHYGNRNGPASFFKAKSVMAMMPDMWVCQDPDHT